MYLQLLFRRKIIEIGVEGHVRAGVQEQQEQASGSERLMIPGRRIADER